MLETIQDHKIDVMLMTEIWYAPESPSMNKLWSRDLGVFKEARSRLPESAYILLTNHYKSGSGFQLHVPSNASEVSFICRFRTSNSNLKKNLSTRNFPRKLFQSFENQVNLHHCLKGLVLITTLLHLTNAFLRCLFCPRS